MKLLVKKQNRRIQELEKMIKFNEEKGAHFFGKPLLADGDWLQMESS